MAGSVTPNLRCRINDTTELNALFGGLSSAIVTVGCIRLGGSVTWGSVPWVNASNNVYGYEVFKLPDGPAGSSGVTFKLTYRSTTAAGYPGISVEVGTDWNSGTGNLTGTGSGSSVSLLGNAPDATLRPTIVSCDDNGLVIAAMWNAPATTTRFLLLIDRQRNSTGTADPVTGWPTPTGFCRFAANGANTGHQLLLVDPAANEATVLTKWPAITRGDLSATKSMLTTVAPAGVMPVYPTLLATRQGTYASKLLVTYSLQDCPVGTDIVIPHLGASRHYTTLSAQFAYHDHLLSAGAAAAVWTSD